jgi:cell division septation protein DedD
MTDEQRSFKQSLGSTERRHRVADGGPIVPAGPPQTYIYELQKQAQTAPRRAVKNKSRMRTAFKAVTRAARKRIVMVVLWVLALGVAADFGYWALVKDNRPAEQAKMPPGDRQQDTLPTDATRVAPSLPEERSLQNLASAPPDQATEQAPSAPPISPTRNAATPASNGGYVVQVSSERSDSEAQASFKTLQSRYPAVLGGRSALIRRVDLGEKGIVYRAQVGPFDKVDEAKQLCGSLKAAGGHCIVQRNS